ncbi:MAG TPA: DUF6752 domain-containing protein [Nocardioides sp.]|nr:DUF6752 domain-containing protein [Nocardioides sp.]
MTSKREQLAGLEQRVDQLESEIAELRRHHLRLAELADVVQELLVPMASRDEDRIAKAIEKFQQSL